jgi:hypothetical protein
MAGTAIAGMAAGAGRSTGTHSTAGSTLVAAALETKHRQHLLNVARVAFGAVHGFITAENQPFKFFTALATLVLVNRHVFLHYPVVNTGLQLIRSVIADRYSR